MMRRCAVLSAVVAAAMLVSPTAALAGDAFLKLGLIFHPDVGGFADRWFVSAGSDWGANDVVFVGLEFQGAYRTDSFLGIDVTQVPANVFVNVKWKSEEERIRPFAGGGMGLISTYVKSEFMGDDEHEWVKHAGLQLMGGVEFNRQWVVEILGQRELTDGAEFSWSFLGGIRW